MPSSTAISDPALVLNASYEPLCVVSGRRAAVLVLTAKAVPVAAGEAVLHSERTALRRARRSCASPASSRCPTARPCR